MDWQALSLSLQLAVMTALLLLPLAILIGRWLAYGHYRGKSLVEALVLLPLVLPPTVLGLILLIAFSPQSALGGTLRVRSKVDEGVEIHVVVPASSQTTSDRESVRTRRTA